jgi:hypothetical protein
MSTRIEGRYRRWRLTKTPIVWPVRLCANAEKCSAGSRNEFLSLAQPAHRITQGPGKPQFSTDSQSLGL